MNAMFERDCIYEVCAIIKENLLSNKYVMAFAVTENEIEKFAENIFHNNVQYDIEGYQKDPAINVSNSPENYARLYNGMKAIIYYRIAHSLLVNMSFVSSSISENLDNIDEEWCETPEETENKKQFFIELSKTLSEKAAKETGIEINPSAQIGKGFVIDHGMGVKIGVENDSTTVIGETCVIGDNCTILNGVILGAKTIDSGETGKRHPTIGNNVTIAAGVRILGNITVGNNVSIAPYCIITSDIPDNTRVLLVNQIQLEKCEEKNDSKIELYGLVPNNNDTFTLYGEGLGNVSLRLLDSEYNAYDAKISILSMCNSMVAFKVCKEKFKDKLVLEIYNEKSSIFYVNSKVLNQKLH